ncbi:hypothetical protein ACFWGN_14905 [Oerskovia sp. NPDC060338]|uniref:hypothetical protein n=1 Tax=Oerskovia sp. NPDC060338 TaxID=3347100 RepID=UPI00365C0E05
MSQTPILENPAQATNLGGYRLTKYREAGGRETTCFSAELTLNGATIATVRNDGNGGSNFYWFKTPQERDAFFAFATTWNAGTRLAGIEDEDEFVVYLSVVAAMNRQRKVAFVLDGDDFTGTGEYRTFPARVTREEAVQALRALPYSAQHPRVWDRDSAQFVAII